MHKKNLFLIGTILILTLAIIFYSNFTFFVIQPIGAIPEGRTLLISRLNKMNFIDSADAYCERTMGGVSLLGRMVVLGAVSKNATIYARFPYSEWLYLVSTNGKKYLN